MGIRMEKIFYIDEIIGCRKILLNGNYFIMNDKKVVQTIQFWLKKYYEFNDEKIKNRIIWRNNCNYNYKITYLFFDGKVYKNEDGKIVKIKKRWIRISWRLRLKYWIQKLKRKFKKK